jgi:alkylhydroperoxidase family enzyme
MARVPYLDTDDLAPEDRELLARPISLFRVLSHSPGGARAFQGMGGWIRFKCELDPRLRELAILQVGYLAKSPYEWSHHVKIGYDFGVTDADIEALIADTEGRPNDLSELDRLVLRGAREMTADGEMSQATFEALQPALGDKGMVDLCIVIAFYNCVVRFLGSMQMDVEPDYQPYLSRQVSAALSIRVAAPRATPGWRRRSRSAEVRHRSATGAHLPGLTQTQQAAHDENAGRDRGGDAGERDHVQESVAGIGDDVMEAVSQIGRAAGRVRLGQARHRAQSHRHCRGVDQYSLHDSPPATARALSNSRASSPPVEIRKSQTKSTPMPLFRLVKTNGRSPRCWRASRSITSRSAPTSGARSILLMISRSERVMPGPPLRGIFSPAETSIT